MKRFAARSREEPFSSGAVAELRIVDRVVECAGVEFLSPAAHFWGVEFAPADQPARPATAPPQPN